MKIFKKSIITLILISIIGCDTDGTDSINYPEKIFEGNVILKTQQEVDDFGTEHYTRITGYLEIGQIETYNGSITNINELSSLTSIDGFLRIQSLDLLDNINGLSNITQIGAFIELVGNYSLINLDGLNSITSVHGDLGIHYNTKLINLDGFDNIT